jgi:hypothetical protein
MSELPSSWVLAFHTTLYFSVPLAVSENKCFGLSATPTRHQPESNFEHRSKWQPQHPEIYAQSTAQALNCPSRLSPVKCRPSRFGMTFLCFLFSPPRMSLTTAGQSPSSVSIRTFCTNHHGLEPCRLVRSKSVKERGGLREGRERNREDEH